MGGNQSHKFDQQLFHQQWERKPSSIDGKSLWTNKQQPSRQIQQYPIFAQTEDEIELERQLFYLRKDSNELVAATHLQESVKSGLCSNSASGIDRLIIQGRLFLQKIALRLEALQHVPFPDVLHLYYNALTGYKKLSNAVGPFKPQSEQIGFNNEGEAKVWLNSEFWSIHPVSKQGSDSSMVRTLLRLIEDVTDNSTTPRQSPSIVNFIYRNKNEVSFDEALTAIKEYANEFNGGLIPKNLKCIQRIGVDRISQTLIQDNNLVSSTNFPSQRSAVNGHVIVAQQPANIKTSQIEIKNLSFAPRTPLYPQPLPQGHFVHQPVPVNSAGTVGRTSVLFASSGNQYPVTQPIKQIPVSQPISQIHPPINQTVHATQSQNLSASGIRGSRVNFVSQVQPKTIPTPAVNNSQLQTVRPSTVFVKPPQAQRVIQQVIRVSDGQTGVFPPSQVLQHQVIQHQVPQQISQGLVFRQADVIQTPPSVAPVITTGHSQHQIVNVVSNLQLEAPVQNQESQASVKQVAQIQSSSNIVPQQAVNEIEPVLISEQVKSQAHILQSLQNSERAISQSSNNNNNFLQSQEYTQLKQLSNLADYNEEDFLQKNRNFIDRNTMNVEIDNGTTQTYQSYNSSAQKYGLNLDTSSSRYRDVTLDDGKSSEALLAELKGFSSSRKEIPFSTNAYEYSSTSYYNKINSQTPLYTNNFTSSITGNNPDIYTNFNKYTSGESLEDNLEMKYSMTKDLYNQGLNNFQYEQPAHSNNNYQYEEGIQRSTDQYYETNNRYGQEQQQFENHQNYDYNQDLQDLQLKEEYHVDYDPEILADIQKLKG